MSGLSKHLLTVFLILSAVEAKAQQAIINMPSADITPRGQVFLMHETQTRGWEPGRYWYGTNFLTYGVGKGTELALTTYNSGLPRVPNTAVGVGFKTGLPLFRGSRVVREAQLTLGQMIIFSTTGRGIGSFSYGHGSFRLPRAGTRITAGISGGTDELFKKDTVHFIGGVEHRIGRRWMVTTEWFSGRHDFGFVTPGILYHPTSRTVIVAGYKIPNHRSNGKAGFVFEFGIFLGKESGH
ncbi:MAG: hypothetical protein RIR52_1314 [Acidobacteriota bacterium]